MTKLEIKQLAQAIAAELRKAESTSDEAAYLATLPAAEVKKILRGQRNAEQVSIHSGSTVLHGQGG